MSSMFWTNTIWYVLLAIAAVIQLTAGLIAAKMKKLTFAFFLTIMGITLNLETTILIFLKAYTYYPMVIRNSPNPFNDVLAGNLFSQFAVSSSTLIAVILNLKFCWYLVIAIVYGAIETLFLALGIYSHNWYRTWMTMLMFPFAIAFSKYLYRKILEGVRPVFYYLYIFLGLFSLYVVTILWGSPGGRLFGFQHVIISGPYKQQILYRIDRFFYSPRNCNHVCLFFKNKNLLEVGSNSIALSAVCNHKASKACLDSSGMFLDYHLSNYALDVFVGAAVG